MEVARTMNAVLGIRPAWPICAWFAGESGSCWVVAAERLGAAFDDDAGMFDVEEICVFLFSRIICQEVFPHVKVARYEIQQAMEWIA